jgi:hypothetical protein
MNVEKLFDNNRLVLVTILLFVGLVLLLATILTPLQTHSQDCQISTVDELQEMENDLDCNYVLTNDIDASETETWNDGDGFESIGSDDAFTGSLDGNGHTISNLTASGGLFSQTQNARIEDVNLEDVNITGSTNYTGGVVNIAEDTVFQNVSVDGSVSGQDRVGGIVGWQKFGTISNAESSGSVNGDRAVGGIAGSLSMSDISDVNIATEVSGEKMIGGVIGVNRGGKLSNADTDVIDVTGESKVGGLVGKNKSDGSIKDSTFSGRVGGINTDGSGGIAGDNVGSIVNSESSGSVNGDTAVGGLVGYNNGIVSESASTTVVSGSRAVGGFVGYADYDSQISMSYVDMTEQARGSDLVAGELDSSTVVAIDVGEMDTDDYTDSSVVGGFVGYNSGSIDTVYVIGGTVEGRNTIEKEGGFAGYNDGSITTAFGTTEVISNDTPKIVAIQSGEQKLVYWSSDTSVESEQEDRTVSESSLTGDQAVETLAGFDFDEVWETTDSYPQFR